MAPTPELQSLQNIRNIGIIAHIDAGKTTVTERMLFYANYKHKSGEVDKGTTTTDFDPEEQERGITIYGACVTFPWKKKQINLIDTPGHVDFTAEVERALRVLDGAVVVFSSREGVEAQSETVWRQANKYKVPRIAFINKLDREGANYLGTIEQMRKRLNANPLILSLPVGIGPPHTSNPFRGVIDLVDMRMLTFDKSDDGRTVHSAEIPEELHDEALDYRRKLIDELSNYNDELMTIALEESFVPPELMRKVIREATLAFNVQPVLCGSALDKIGVQPVLDAVLHYLPSPADRPPVEGTGLPKKGTKPKEGEVLPTLSRKPDPAEPFCGLIFKIVAEKHGDISYVRIYSGTLGANTRMLNPRTDQKENISQIWRIQADSREQITKAGPGDIVGVIGLRKDSATGDTLCDGKDPIVLETITFPETVISMAIEPDSSNDRKKLAETLEQLKRQDPTFRAQTNEETGQTLISGMGELHLEIIKNRLLRDFNLNVKVHKPRVSYRETVAQAVELTGTCDRNIGGQSLFATVKIKLEPFETGEDAVRIGNRLVGPVAELYGDMVMEMLTERAHGSGLAGFPLMKVKLTAIEIHMPEGQTNEVALRLAAADAFEQALQKAGVVLLEPIMKLEVRVPEDHVGNIVGDLLQRRAKINRNEPIDGTTVIEAEVPLANMFGYSGAMRSLSQGRASCSMEPHEYAPAPNEVRDQFMN